MAIPGVYKGLLGPLLSVFLLPQWYNQGGRAPRWEDKKVGAQCLPRVSFDTANVSLQHLSQCCCCKMVSLLKTAVQVRRPKCASSPAGRRSRGREKGGKTIHQVRPAVQGQWDDKVTAACLNEFPKMRVSHVIRKEAFSSSLLNHSLHLGGTLTQHKPQQTSPRGCVGVRDHTPPSQWPSPSSWPCLDKLPLRLTEKQDLLPAERGKVHSQNM